MPKSCFGCKHFAENRRQCNLELCLHWSEEKQKYNDCPLKSLHEYKKELVAKVLDKIKMLAKDNFDFDMCNECGEFVHNDNVLTESDFNKVLNQIQKEFENV